MGSLTKSMIGKEDMSIQTNTSAAETFSRLASAGSTISLTKIPDIWDGTGKIRVAEARTQHFASHYSSLLTAVSSVNSLTDKILYIDNGDWAIGTTDLSAYTSVVLAFLPGATVSPTVGTTLTIYSPSNIIAQPNQQIFSGAGTVDFGSGGVVYPDWWGNNTSPGTTDMESAIEAADASFGSNKGIIAFISGEYASAGDITHDSSIHLKFFPNSKVSPAVTKTYTISSSYNLVDVNPTQTIFGGAGTITFTNRSEVYPNWWGVDGTADNVQMQAAIDTLPATGGIVRLTGGYTNAVAVTLDDYIDLIGDGMYSTKITMSAAANCILTASYNRVANFSIDGNTAATGSGVAVQFDEHDVTIDSMFINDVGWHSIILSGCYNVNLSNLRLEGAGHRNINIGMDIPTSSLCYDININNVIAKNAGLANIIMAHKCSKITINNFMSIGTTEAASNGMWIAHTAQDIILNNCISTGAVANGLVLQAETYEVNISNSIFAANGSHGIYFSASEADEHPGNGDVSAITVSNCTMYSNTLSGIGISDGGAYVTKNLVISGNVIYANGSYGIDASDPDSTTLIIDSNIFAVNSSGHIRDTTTNGLLYGKNSGWVTQAQGVTGAIASGTAVNHGLSVTPTSVVTSAAESGPTDIYVTEVGATSFKINFGGGGNKAFYWYART